MKKILCFPLDNTEYEASAMGAFCGTRTRGVVSAESNLQVQPGGSMTVKVQPGLAWIKPSTYWGACILLDAAQTLAISTANGSLSRFDVVCLRLDKNANREELVIKSGDPAQVPTYPPILRNLDYEELYLAAIRVRAGAISIQTEDIIDLRLNEQYCGLMRDGVTAIPTQALFDAWWNWFSTTKEYAEAQVAEFTAWMKGFKSVSESDFDQWFTDFTETQSGAFAQWYGIFTQTSEADFTRWFNELKNTLNENQAANLFSMIDAHREKVLTSEEGIHGIRFYGNRLQVQLPSGWATVGKVLVGMSAGYFDRLSFTKTTFDNAQYTAGAFDTQIETEEF